MAEKTNKRIAIVGGGIAGLYTAWRILKDANSSLKVEIFEVSDSLGGRIKSQLIPGVPFKAELGAMRFRSNHRLLKALLDEFSIPIRDFDVSPPKLRVRGRSLSIQEITNGGCSHCAASIPYHLKKEERGKSPEQLVVQVIQDLLKNLSFPTLQQTEASRVKQKIAAGNYSTNLWQKIKECGQYDNTPLYSIGFWNLLQHSLSNEAFQLIHDALSLESVLGNWSAAEAIPWFLSDFASQELYMVSGGMQTIIEELEANIKKFRGRYIIRKQSLVLECRKEQFWQVTYQNAQNKENVSEFDEVVLALPQLGLQRLKILTEKGETWQPKWLDWVHPHRLYKLFLLYENEWWMGDDAPGSAAGRIFTDLPLRQVYYFGPKWMQKFGKDVNQDIPLYGEKGTENWSLVMASYSDDHYVSFWQPPISLGEPDIQEESLRLYYRSPANVGRTSARNMKKVFEKEIPDQFRAYDRTVRKVQQQLYEIHGHNVPDPIIGVYKDWGESPIGAGWHTWKVGAKSWHSKKRIANETDTPDENKPTIGGLELPQGLHICGEAYSSEQGWIEGALKTSEIVLQDLKISPPSWKHARKIENFDEYIFS